MDAVKKNTGSFVLNKPSVIALLFLITVLCGYIIEKGQIISAAGLIALPFLLIYVNQLFKTPKLGIYSVIFLGFIANGLSRYIKGLPFGLTIDSVLILTYLAIIFKDFYNRIDWKPASKDVTFLAIIWFGYALFQLINPEARSKAAWFYAMRGVAFYMFLLVPLVLLLIKDYKDLNKILYLWGIMSMLATLKGFIQLNFGVDPFEKAWLDGGGAVTHILFGKLRVFSFFSDAGQFGAAQAHAGVVGAIIFINSRTTKDRIFFGLMAITGLYGMFISGTRGAIAVPFAGLAMYLILTRNVKMMTLGGIFGIVIFVFFKFTTIGANVYAINRMRSAFDPNDKSLLVRLENQRKLKVYLSSRPFGGGIGSAGNWGQRFTPTTFLANTATDSWYVQIWAEQGIIGLTLHLLILFYILGKGAYISMYRVRDPVLQSKLFAMAAGMMGIMGASYGNGVLGQIPTGPIMYTTMAVLFLGETLDASIPKKEEIAVKDNLEYESKIQS
nr:O-antigen ligase family protein [Bacteroidota bacterium]